MCEVLFLNQHRLGVDIHLTDEYIEFPQARLYYIQITSVFNRMLSPLLVEDAYSVSVYAYFNYLLDCVFAKVINRPANTMSNSAKPYQLQLLAKHELMFSYPQHCILANKSDATIPDGWIFKSICSVRSIVCRVNSKAMLVKEPVLFQACILGDNIRVHVLGSKVFAVQISSDRLDYRYAQHVDMEAVKLPAEIINDCVRAVEILGLIFAGIDLIKLKNTYYLLEVNPSPGYAYFERHLMDSPISEALIDFLA